jgi:hypothetical protein
MQLPFVFIHPSKLGWLFNTKAIIVPIVAFGTLIWVSSGKRGGELGLIDMCLGCRQGWSGCVGCTFITRKQGSSWCTEVHRLYDECDGLSGDLGHP